MTRRRIPAKFTGGAATPPLERGTPCSICRDGPCSVSTRNVTPAATGCAPTPRPRTNAAIAARCFITSRHRWARGSACARVHWEAIVRISGRADCIAGRRVRSRPRLLSPREKKRSGRWGDGRSWVRGTEYYLCSGAACVPVARELLQPGQWPEFPRPAFHVEHILILAGEVAPAYGRLVPYV